MSVTRFIGCLHLGDERLVKDFRGFATSEEHDNHLIERWNSVVSDTDTVYILGDISMESAEPYTKLALLKGKKIVVMGNHDRPEDIPELLKYVDGVCGMKYLEVGDSFHRKQCIWLSHAPLHPQELVHVDFNIHSHIHHMEVPKTEIICDYWYDFTKVISKSNVGYVNVDAHLIGYEPKTIDELINPLPIKLIKGKANKAVKQNLLNNK